MPARFVNIDRDTPLLLPPKLKDWVPANHLCLFTVDAVEELNLREVKVNERGTGRYRLRQQTVEPVFGIIKSVIGFRRFLLRGLEKVSLEWTWVSVAYNLKRLHRMTLDYPLCAALLLPSPPRSRRG